MDQTRVAHRGSRWWLVPLRPPVGRRLSLVGVLITRRSPQEMNARTVNEDARMKRRGSAPRRRRTGFARDRSAEADESAAGRAGEKPRAVDCRV
jgi:hypothetical protein